VLLGVGAAQRGASDLGDPEVRACLAGVRAVLGPDVADGEIERARALPRGDGVMALERYVRGGAGSGGAVAESASATSRA